MLWILDFGLWTSDFGLWTSDFGLRTLDFGLWTSDFGLWTSDFGLRTLVYGLRLWSSKLLVLLALKYSLSTDLVTIKLVFIVDEILSVLFLQFLLEMNVVEFFLGP